MIRPKCSRCGGPLDLWHEPADDSDPAHWTFICNSIDSRTVAGRIPIMTDWQFQAAWDNLPGDDVVRLEKMLTTN